MQVISAKTAQQNLDTICEQVYQNHEPYIVNRENYHNVVILSLDDYNSWTETNYLLSNPYNNTVHFEKERQDIELEQAYRDAAQEFDSSWEITTLDGLSNETW